MTQLGVNYDVLREVNPKIVMCSMSGFGATGPERNYSAYGSNIETVSGLASVLGYGPEKFYPTGTFYADPVAGTHGAVAMLAALHAADRTGQGQWIDMGLLETATPFLRTRAAVIRRDGGRAGTDGQPLEPVRAPGCLSDRRR